MEPFPPWLINKGGHAHFFCRSANIKPENFWAYSAVAKTQVSNVCQSANRKTAQICNDWSQIANRKISLVSQFKNCCVFDPDLHWFASNIFTYVYFLPKYMLEYKIPWTSVTQKCLKTVTKAKRHICGRSANLKKIEVRKFADLRFTELSCGPPTFANSLIFCLPAFKQWYRLLQNAGVPYMLNF